MNRTFDPNPRIVKSPEGASSAWLRLWRDRGGATAVLVAISLPILLAVAGLGVDAGWWYTVKRQNQSAADAAAMSAAYQVAAEQANNVTPTAASLVTAAQTSATKNGYSGPALGSASATPPTACTDPGGSYVCYQVAFTYGGVTSPGVQVVLRQPQNSWLANFASLANVTIANEATAIVDTLPPGCMLALGRNPPPNNGVAAGPQTLNQAVSEKGNATIDAPNCTIVSDSNSPSAFYLQGSVTIDAATLVTPGGITNTGGAYTLDLAYPAQTGANPVSDPYAPAPYGSCTTLCLTHNFLVNNPAGPMPTTPACTKKNATTWNGNCVVPSGSIKVGQTLSANTQISGGLTIKNGEVDLLPGTYWITDGDLTLDSGTGGILKCPTCSAGGPGVTIILTTAQASKGTVGTLTLSSNAKLTLNAPDSGPFAGLVLIQDSWNLPPNTTITTQNKTPANANASESVSGLVYFPDTTLSFQGTPTANTGAGACLVLVANDIQLQGNPTFATSGCGQLGLKQLPVVKTVNLVALVG